MVVVKPALVPVAVPIIAIAASQQRANDREIMNDIERTGTNATVDSKHCCFPLAILLLTSYLRTNYASPSSL